MIDRIILNTFFKTKLDIKVSVFCQCTLLDMTILIFSVSADNGYSEILSRKMTSTTQVFFKDFKT